MCAVYRKLNAVKIPALIYCPEWRNISRHLVIPHIIDPWCQLGILASRNWWPRSRKTPWHITMACINLYGYHVAFKRPFHLPKSDRCHIIVSETAVGTFMLGQHFRFFKNRPREYNPTATSTDASAKNCVTLKLKILLFLRGDKQLPGPLHMTRKAGNRRNNDKGGSQSTRPYSTYGSATLPEALQRLSTIFAKCFATGGTAQ